MKTKLLIFAMLIGLSASAQFTNFNPYGVQKSNAGDSLRLVGSGSGQYLYLPSTKMLRAAINSIPAPVTSVNGISDLKNYSGGAVSVIVKDKNRGGIFNYTTSSMASDDGVIFPATGKGSGYWVRQYTGAYVNVQWFPNIVADSVTDCSAGINAIPVKYMYRYFPAGNYKLNAPIVLDGSLSHWSIMGDDIPLKTESKSTVFISGFSGNVFDTESSYSYEGIQFKNFQIVNVSGGYGINSGWPETKIDNVRMLLNYGNGVKIAYITGSNGAFDCTITNVKIEGRYTDTPVTYSGTGLYIDRGSNNLLFSNSFLYGFSNAIIIKSSENVNIIQNNINASGGDYAIKVVDTLGTSNLNIENNYIESQNRAFYVNKANGVHFLKNQVSDASFGGNDDLGEAHLYFGPDASSVSVSKNTVSSTFQNQSFIHAENNITLEDNFWLRNRTGSTFLGINFDIPESSWQRDTLKTITIGTVATGINRYNSVKNYIGINDGTTEFNNSIAKWGGIGTDFGAAISTPPFLVLGYSNVSGLAGLYNATGLKSYLAINDGSPLNNIASNSTQWNGQTIGVTGLASGDFIRYNGTNWVNSKISQFDFANPTGTLTKLAGFNGSGEAMHWSDAQAKTFLGFDAKANIAGGNTFSGVQTFSSGTLQPFNAYSDSGFLNTVQSNTLSSNVNTYFPSYGGVMATTPDTGASAPTPTSTGTKGQKIYNSGYMYECIATNTWIRSVRETTW